MGNFPEKEKRPANDGPSSSSRATSEIEAKLVGLWEELLEKRPIGLREDFFDLGGHSLLAFQMCVKIQEMFNRSLSVATLFDAPTIEQLALVLSGEASTLAASRPLLFCIPVLLNLARLLGAEQPFYGLTFPQPSVLRQPETTTEGIAAECIRQIRAVQDKGPYYLCGYSFGGVVAFEIARQMAAQQEEVALLALLEPDPPRPYPTKSAPFHVRRYAYHVRRLARLSLPGQLRYLGRSIRKEMARRAPILFPPEEPVLQERVFAQMTEAIHERYQAKCYRGPLKLLLARDTQWRQSGSEDPRLEWFRFATGKADFCEVPGNHDDFYKEPHVGILAQKVASYLAEAAPTNAAYPSGT